MMNSDDLYYIDLVKNGDSSAYSYLVEKYSDMVYSLALKIIHNETDAEDLAQEVFISAYKSLTNFKGNSKFSTWLYRITYNKAISKLRKSEKVWVTEDEIFLENHSEHELQIGGISDEEETLELLSKNIAELPQEEQFLIMLHYFDNQSIEEIAQITMLSVSNVKVKLFRIRKKLKICMESVRAELITINS